MKQMKQVAGKKKREKEEIIHYYTDGCRRRVFPLVSYVLTAIVFLSSCTASPATTFPTVSFTDPQGQTESAEKTEPSLTSSVSDETEVIRVAAPISSQTAKYLSLLYVAKKRDLLPEGETGNTIKTDYLLTIEPEFLVEAIQTPSTGATYDMFEDWSSDQIRPDIIYVNSLTPFCDNNQIVPLTESLASVDTLTPDRIYPEMFGTCYVDDFLYGIPYAASAKLLFWNQEVTKASGRDFLPFSLSISDLESISYDIAAMNPADGEQSEKMPYYAFYDPEGLLPLLPRIYDRSAGWFTKEEDAFRFKTDAFRKTASFFQAYSAQPFFSVNALGSEEHAKEFSTMDPRISGRVAVWVGSSFDVAYWSTALPDVTVTKIPAATEENGSPLALTVYPLCVSADAENPELAAEFAAFIATDEDAVLLTDRLENRSGFLPVISSDAVWRLVLQNKTYGDRFLDWKKDMTAAMYDPHTNQENTSEIIDMLLEKYVPMMLLPETDMEQLITDMSTESRQLM